MSVHHASLEGSARIELFGLACVSLDVASFINDFYEAEVFSLSIMSPNNKKFWRSSLHEVTRPSGHNKRIRENSSIFVIDLHSYIETSPVTSKRYLTHRCRSGQAVSDKCRMRISLHRCSLCSDAPPSWTPKMMKRTQQETAVCNA